MCPYSYSSTTEYAYDATGNKYCEVDPYEYAQGVTTYNSSGQVVQVTNPLGGITLTSYDPAGNVLSTTVESDNTTNDRDVTTSYTYDGDNRVLTTTVGSGSDTSTTAESYDPNSNVCCSVSANAYATGSYQCPSWQPWWISEPPSPSSLYSTAPSTSQANDVTTAFYNADGDMLQTTNPGVETSISSYDADGRTTCSEDAVNLANWLAANPSATYSYNCPAPALTTPPIRRPRRFTSS